MRGAFSRNSGSGDLARGSLRPPLKGGGKSAKRAVQDTNGKTESEGKREGREERRKGRRKEREKRKGGREGIQRRPKRKVTFQIYFRYRAGHCALLHRKYH